MFKQLKDMKINKVLEALETVKYKKSGVFIFTVISAVKLLIKKFSMVFVL